MNRPLTRRRRENTEECLDKLQQIRDNLAQATALVGNLVKREQKKRDIMVRSGAQRPGPWALAWPCARPCLLRGAHPCSWLLPGPACCRRWLLLSRAITRPPARPPAQLAELEMLRLQLRLMGEPKSTHEALEAQTIQDFKTKLKSKADSDSKPKVHVRYDMPDGVILPQEVRGERARRSQRRLPAAPPACSARRLHTRHALQPQRAWHSAARPSP